MKLLQKLVLAILILIIPGAASAMQFTLGTDAVRSVDQAQYEGMMNAYLQIGFTKKASIIVGYSSSSEAHIIDCSYRHYLNKYHDGMYLEGGGTLLMLDSSSGDDDDEEIGGFIQFGFETSPAKHFVIGVGARMIMGYDHPHTQEKDPIFLPVVNFAFAF